MVTDSLKEIIEDILYNTLETEFGVITSSSINSAVNNICDVVKTLEKQTIK